MAIAVVTLAVLVGAVGGTLVFSQDPGWVRGIGLLLIVVFPLALAELLKERPQQPRRRL